MTRIAVIIALLIVYGSLYPWRFPATQADVRGHSQWTLRGSEPLARRILLRDAVFNVALYVPFGAAAYLALRRRMSSAAAAGIAAGSGAALSFAVEIAQLWQPSRFSSIYDVIANGIGTFGGAVAALIAAKGIGNTPAVGTDRNDPQAFALLAVGVASLLFPFLPSGSVANMIAKAAMFFGTSPAWLVRFAMVAAMWVAAGALLEAARVSRGRMWLAVSVALMPAQILLSRRQPFLTDMIAAAGATVLYAVLTQKGARKFAVGACIVLVALRGAIPYDSPAWEFQWMPFRAALDGDWQSGTVILLEKAYLYGACIWLLNRHAYLRPAYATAAMTVLLAAIEIAQFSIAGRTPETTDPLLAILMGVCLEGLQSGHEAAPQRSTARVN